MYFLITINFYHTRLSRHNRIISHDGGDGGDGDDDDNDNDNDNNNHDDDGGSNSNGDGGMLTTNQKVQLRMVWGGYPARNR